MGMKNRIFVSLLSSRMSTSAAANMLSPSVQRPAGVVLASSITSDMGSSLATSTPRQHPLSCHFRGSKLVPKLMPHGGAWPAQLVGGGRDRVASAVACRSPFQAALAHLISGRLVNTSAPPTKL